MLFSRLARAFPIAIAVYWLIIYTGCNIPTVRKGKVACCPRFVRPRLEEVKVGMAMNALPHALQSFKTDASGAGLFWARWYDQYSQVVWAGSPDDRSYSPPGYGWSLVNFVGTYDAGGTLNRYRFCSERELTKCLQTMDTMSPEQRARTRLEFRAMRKSTSKNGGADFQGTVAFSADGALLQGTEQVGTSLPRSITFQYPIGKISVAPFLSTRSTQGTISLIIVLTGGIGPDWVDVSASPLETRLLIGMLSSGKRNP